MLLPRLVPFGLLGALCLGACDDGVRTHAMFEPPGAAAQTAEFYDLPFPNDLRRHDDGTLDLSLFPTNSLIVEQIRAAAESLDGFGLNSAIYARFDGELDPASLPDAATSVQEGASVYLVNVDPDSPDRGTRMPILVKFRPTGNQTLGIDNLVTRPYPGFPLDEGTTYALVITRRVKDLDGNAVEPATQLTRMMGTATDPAIVHARTVYQPLLDYLDEADGDSREDVVTAAVFTTQHATRVAPALRKGVYGTPAPVATDIASSTVGTDYSVWVGNYQAPNFQAGDVPYRTAPSGEIKVGADGAAIVTRMEPMRFAVSVPSTAMPTNGYPICIYSHGTGGNYVSFVNDGTAQLLALQGIAVISTDQVLHGPRNPGGNPELDFFNFGNVYAARDNALQGFADAWSQQRLAAGLTITAGPRTIKFDPTKVSFFGHSQGGVTGPGFVAFEPALTGAVLSGTAGLLYLNLLHKTNPLDIPALVETFVRDQPVDEDNPSLALVQMWIERSDSVNYAPLMVRHPGKAPDGTALAPRNIFQTEGFTDTYAPNIGIEAFATALGGDLVQLPDQLAVEGLTLRGRSVKPAPFMDNLGGVTAALAQYKQKAGSDGHFVVFDIASAKHQAGEFLGTLVRTGKATVVTAN